MDKRKYKYDKIGWLPVDQVPAIVVEGPSYDRLPYADEDMVNPDEESDRVGDMKTITTDANVEDGRRIGRRNSISLPNLDDLKVLNENINQVSC